MKVFPQTFPTKIQSNRTSSISQIEKEKFNRTTTTTTNFLLAQTSNLRNGNAAFSIAGSHQSESIKTNCRNRLQSSRK